MITEEMVNRADSVLSTVRGGIPDKIIRSALEAALAVAEPVAFTSRGQIDAARNGSTALLCGKRDEFMNIPLYAQVREVKTFINLNANVRVQLTEHGKIILAMDEYATEKPDENGFIEMQLWRLMRVFGSVMFMGNPNLPFENMNVELLFDAEPPIRLPTALSLMIEKGVDPEQNGYCKVIDVEKFLCAKLGKEWSATGISIVSLVDELCALSAQVQDVSAKSLADAYQKYLDASDIYNERLAILKTKALGTMRVDEEYRAIDEARRAFDKLAVDIAKSALAAAPAKQDKTP